MNSTLANTDRRIDFYALAGVEDVRVVDEEVVGRWKALTHPFYGLRKGRLVEEFANWSNDVDGVLRFTKRYGPLDDVPRAGQEFRLRVEIWRASQMVLRRHWERLANLRRLSGLSIQVQPGERLLYRNGRLVYKVATLSQFLLLDLFTCSRERLRKCHRPDCPNPYFMVHHLRQNYCSQVCARWAQRQWKLAWWERKGKKRRAQRQRNKRGAKGKKKSSRGRR